MQKRKNLKKLCQRICCQPCINRRILSCYHGLKLAAKELDQLQKREKRR